ncbi:sulfatase-like hydrolase/transferase [Haloferula sp.]|uniref:sulfatase-like hydrolase/transferase n=1 Tax=Haloferula sp. TaxID=2497595 RepID=UPI00329FD2AA
MRILRTILVAGLIAQPATLRALDTNGNGISDVWESLHAAAAANLTADDDADGCSNGAEGQAWTDPGDPASFFKPSNFSAGSGTDQFDFQSERWMRDNVHGTDDLVSWTRQSEAVQSDGTPGAMSVTTSGPRKFYSISRYDSLNSDTDSLTNKEEEILGTDPDDWDSDGDKVADDIEFLNGTDPLVRDDSDTDGIDDDFEWWCIKANDTDGFTDLTHIHATTDFDGDSVLDGDEFNLGTSPVVPLRNILYFITEDQNIHLGLYDTNPADGFAGDSATPANNRTRGIQTPHLDTLGGAGVVFDRAFALSPVCSPSKMAFYTGTFPHTNSAHRNVTNYGINFPLPTPDPSELGLGGVHEDLPTLIEIFRDRGWFTAVSSKSHVQPIRKFPYHEGYANLSTPAVAANAMDDVIAQAGDRPFFFWANLGSPHLPFHAVPNNNGVWNQTGPLIGDGEVTNVNTADIDVPDCYPDVPAVRQDITNYLGNIEVIDGIFQACVDRIADAGLTGETIIVFTSDHGIGLHRAKQSVYSAGLHIPFLISGPGISGGRRIREPISHLDVTPTLTALAGTPQMPSHLGKSLWPILDGTQNDFPDRKTMLTACHRYYNGRAVTDGRYYYIRNLSQPTGGSLAFPNPVLNQDQYKPGSPWYNNTYGATVAATGTPQREFLRQIVEGDLPPEELYDLDADLWCTNNLIDDPSLASIKSELQRELGRWRRDTEDYNTDSSEMTRREERFDHIDPAPPVPVPGGLGRGDDFDGKSGALNADPDWSLDIAGNGGADFTLGSNQVDAPAGPVTLATFGPQDLVPGSSFLVSVKTGFDGTGVGSGVAFGIVDDGGSKNFWQFMLADGRSAPGGIDKDVRLFRVDQGSQVTPALISDNTLQDYPAGFNAGDLFTVEVSGTGGSPLVDLRIYDPNGDLYYENLTFDLGLAVPDNSEFGITSWSSGNSVFDEFSVLLGGPLTTSFDFESSGNHNDDPDWTTLLFGNSSADFTFVAEPFGGGGTSLKAPAGPLALASHDPVTIGSGKSFTAKLDVGYPATGIYGGLTFGLVDSDNWFSFELGNGNVAAGASKDRLFRIRQSDAGTITNLLHPPASTLPLITQDRFYRLTLSGEAGSTMINYDITDTVTSGSLTSGTLNLGVPLPAGSRFGVIATSSTNTHFDTLELTLD